MKLIIFSGLPGTGKSALAEAVGRRLGLPVFAKDCLEATLLRAELTPSNPDLPLGSEIISVFLNGISIPFEFIKHEQAYQLKLNFKAKEKSEK